MRDNEEIHKEVEVSLWGGCKVCGHCSGGDRDCGTYNDEYDSIKAEWEEMGEPK